MNQPKSVSSSAADEKVGVRENILDAISRRGRRSELRELCRILELGPTIRLLDVGGRTGTFTSRFAPPYERVVILEVDPLAARRGKLRRRTLQFVIGRGEAIPFLPDSFDRITAIRSTHHMHAPEEFFQEANRVLADRGRIVIEEIAPGSSLANLMSRLFGRRHHHPLDFRSPKDWENGLVQAGFVGVRVTSRTRRFFVSGTKAVRRDGLPE